MKNTEIINRRSSLVRTQNALRNGKITIGFIGGSITEQRPELNWPEPVTSWFVENYPDVKVYVENTAMGASCSDLAAFRVKQDLLDRNCDLVFVEFAVNDNGMEIGRRKRAREGLIRKLLKSGTSDVVLVYTFCQDMYQDMANDRVPQSIAEFEELAEYYGLSSVWMGKYAFEEIKKGRMRWHEWLPDTLHPSMRGSLSYAQSVIQFIKESFADNNIKSIDRIPEPINPANWEHTEFIPFDNVKTVGPWKIRRSTSIVWQGFIMETASPGAKLSFEYEGRELSMGSDFGKYSADYKLRVDDGEWKEIESYRGSWVPDKGWFKIEEVIKDDVSTKHKVEIEIYHGDKGPDFKGTTFAIAFFGVVK